jgi:hypothetical protein
MKSSTVAFQKNSHKKLEYDVVISLQNSPQELKAGTQTAMYTPMFVAPLFTVSKRWKQLNCASRMNG